MRPASGSAIIRPDLGKVMMEFVEGPTMGYVGLEVMPIYPVAEQSAGFPVIPKEALLKIGDTKRAPRGAYNRADYEYEVGKYSTSEHGREEPVDDSERKMLDRRAPGLADRVAVKRAWGHIMRSAEYRIASKIFNASNFTANAVSNEWDDATNATPIDDVEAGKLSFRSACGMLPDALIIAFSTFSDLKQCDQVVNRLKYTFPGIDINRMNSAQLAAVFDVPRVLVAGSVYDSAKKGQTASIADIWSNEYAALVKIGSGDDIAEPCIGRTFLWTEDSPQNPIVEQYREEQIRSDVYRVRHHVDECLIKSYDDTGTAVSNISAACCFLFSNITT